MLDQRWQFLETYPGFRDLREYKEATFPIDGESVIAASIVNSGGLDMFLAKTTDFSKHGNVFHMYRFFIWHNIGHVDLYDGIADLLGKSPVDDRTRYPVEVPRFIHRGNYPYRIDVPKLCRECKRDSTKYTSLKDLYDAVYKGAYSYLESVSIMMNEATSSLDHYSFMRICSLHDLDPMEYMWVDRRNDMRLDAYNKLVIASESRKERLDQAYINIRDQHIKTKAKLRL